jgi:hypothetical protein
VVDDAGEHCRQLGTDQFGIGLEVLTHLLEDGGVAVDADHEALAEHQLHLPEADFSSAASHLTVLTTANSRSPTTSGAGRLVTAPSCSTSGSASPNSRWTDANSSGLGSRRLTQTKVSPDAVAPSPPDRSWVGGSRVCHHASRRLPRAAIA